MRRNEALAVLRAHIEDVRRYSVRSLALFGSVARDEATPSSDVDVLVEFAETPRWAAFLDLKEYLERLLGRPVDLVTRAALPPRKRARIDSEAIVVA
jgi:predicted nucleotidyltransferase